MDLMSALPGVKVVWKWFLSRLGLNREHDVAIFRKLDAILDEPRVEDILNGSIYTSHLQVQEKDLLYQFVDALRRIENQYLETVVQLRANELAWEMEQLLRIVSKTFWSVPGGHLKFRPDYIAPEIYEADWEELNEELEKAWEAYRTYREAVNQRLKV